MKKSNLKIYIETLGCNKNQVDSEIMIGILKSKGYNLVQSPNKAELIIINTCGFIESAKVESLDTTFDLISLKENGILKFVIMTGCLSQRYSKDLFEEIPEIDAFVGTGNFHRIDQIIEDVISGNRVILVDNINTLFPEDLPRILSTPKHYAFLKISEGCDNDCTYCIIPKLRGNYRSRKMEDIIFEANMLSKKGVKELIIIAQDSTRYGIDIYSEYKLWELLDKLNNIDGINWIRIQYAYPDVIDDKLIDSIARNNKVVKYIDMPLQHISDKVLKRMNRHTSKESIISIIKNIKLKVPDIKIRTTFMVGFPGETEEDFDELLNFIKWARFDKLGAFEYSKEEDTPAYKLDNQIEDEVKKERFSRLMDVQMEISQSLNESYVNKILKVVIDEKVENEDVYICRSEFDTPEVDGIVYLYTNKKIKIGQFVDVKIIEALEYDLIGELYELS